MILLDSFWSYSKEPLLLTMFGLTVVNLFFMARLLFRRKNVVEKDLVSRFEVLNNGCQRVPEVSSIVQGIHTVHTDETVDIKIPLQKNKKKLDPDINFLPITDGSDECKYCIIFKDLSSIVCPSCGRPLRARTIKTRKYATKQLSHTTN